MTPGKQYMDQIRIVRQALVESKTEMKTRWSEAL